jgi:hypothetical protein
MKPNVLNNTELVLLARGKDFSLTYNPTDAYHLQLLISTDSEPMSTRDPGDLHGPNINQIRIPFHVWQSIAQIGTFDTGLAEASDDALHDLAELQVNTRSALLEPQPGASVVLESISGFEHLGNAEVPVVEQIETGFNAFQRQREWEQCLLERSDGARIERDLRHSDFAWLGMR